MISASRVSDANIWKKLLGFIIFSGVTVDAERECLHIKDPKGCIINEECWPPTKFKSSDGCDSSAIQIYVSVIQNFAPKYTGRSKKPSKPSVIEELDNFWSSFTLISPIDIPLEVTIIENGDSRGFSNISSVNKHEGIILKDRQHGVDWTMETFDEWVLVPNIPEDMVIETSGSGDPLKLFHDIQFTMQWDDPLLDFPIVYLKVDLARLMPVVQEVMNALGFPTHKFMASTSSSDNKHKLTATRTLEITGLQDSMHSDRFQSTLAWESSTLSTEHTPWTGV